jgi:hypothetical protein
MQQISDFLLLIFGFGMQSRSIFSPTLRNLYLPACVTAGRGVIGTVGEEIDRLEAELKEMVPGLVYVDLETDKGKMEQLERALASGEYD